MALVHAPGAPYQVGACQSSMTKCGVVFAMMPRTLPPPSRYSRCGVWPFALSSVRSCGQAFVRRMMVRMSLAQMAVIRLVRSVCILVVIRCVLNESIRLTARVQCDPSTFYPGPVSHSRNVFERRNR